MTFVDTLAPIIKLVMYVAYGLYVVLGVVMVAIAIAALVKKITTTVALGICIAGVAMIIVGSGSFYFVWNENWLPLMIIQLINFVLFFSILATGITAYLIAKGYSDPIQATFDGFFDEWREDVDGYNKEFGICYTFAEENDGEDWEDCRTLYFLNTDCTVDDIDGQLDDTQDIWDDHLYYMGDCEEYQTQLDTDGTPAEGLLYVEWATTECETAFEASNYEQCKLCFDECEENLVAITKDQSQTIAIVMFSLWFFFVLTALVNNHVIHSHASDSEELSWKENVGSLWAIITYVFNGLVIIMALTLMTLGIIAYVWSNSEHGCPTGEDCPGAVFMFVTITGFGMLVCGVTAILGMKFGMKGLLMLTNIILVVLCILLLIGVVFAGLSVGVFGEATDAIEENYEDRRDDIRAIHDTDEFVNFCSETCEDAGKVNCNDDTACDDEDGAECYECVDVACTEIVYYSGPSDGYMDFEDEQECVDDIIEKIEDYMYPLGIVAISVCVFFVGLMFFTQIAIDIFKHHEQDEAEELAEGARKKSESSIPIS